MRIPKLFQRWRLPEGTPRARGFYQGVVAFVTRRARHAPKARSSAQSCKPRGRRKRG